MIGYYGYLKILCLFFLSSYVSIFIFGTVDFSFLCLSFFPYSRFHVNLFVPCF